MALPSLVDPGAIARGAALLDIAQSPHPYLSPSHALLRWTWIPLVTLSSLALVLGPGLMVTLAAGVARSAAQWLLMGLAVSVVVLSLAAETVEAVTGAPLRGSAFAAVALGTSLLAALVAAARPRPPWLPSARIDRHTLAAAAAGAVALMIALEPKFLWETFNGDGAHAYESARLLLYQASPFWSSSAGALSNYPGVTSFLASYPTAWFIRLFGETEAAGRIPYLLFLAAGLYPGLVMLIEAGRADAGEIRARWLLWLGLAVFSVVMAFSATYNPYHADIGLPATQDALLVAWFLGFAWAFVSQRHGWMTLFAALTYATSPGGLVLLGLWLCAAFVFLRPMPWRSLVLAAAAIAGCVVLARLSPALLGALGFPVPGSEHSTGSMASRLLRVQWRDWRRVIWIIVPGGILPSVAVLLVWRQDRIARAVAAVAAMHFAFFYLQSRVSLHYFVPAMVLPLVVFWRTAPDLWRGKGLSAAVTAAALVALVLSLPAHKGPELTARPVGAAIDDRMPGYDETRSESFARSELLSTLLPRDAHHTVPDSSYGGSPLSWFYYAHRASSPRPVHYVFQRAADPAPPGARLSGTRGDAALYVVDEAGLAQDRAYRPPNTVARIYRISKHTLFRGN
jgi:hypothetical protein